MSRTAAAFDGRRASSVAACVAAPSCSPAGIIALAARRVVFDVVGRVLGRGQPDRDRPDPVATDEEPSGRHRSARHRTRRHRPDDRHRSTPARRHRHARLGHVRRRRPRRRRARSARRWPCRSTTTIPTGRRSTSRSPACRRPTRTSASARSCSTRVAPAGRGSTSCRRRPWLVPAEISERFDLVGLRPAWRRCQHRRRLRHRDRRQHRAAGSGRRRRLERPARRGRGPRRHLPADGARPRPVRRDEQRRPRSRPDPGGARRRPAQLRRVLLRHPARRDLRRTVPRQRVGRSCSTAASSRRTTPPNSTGSRARDSTSRSRTSPPPATPTRTASSASSARRSRCTPRSSPRSPRLGSFATDDPDRVLTPGELQLGVAAALYSKDAWPYLAEALYLADTEQDGSLLQVLGDGLVGPPARRHLQQRAGGEPVHQLCRRPAAGPTPTTQRVRGGRGGRRIGVVRRLPAGQHRLHRHARRDRPAGVRARRRRGADPRDRQLGRSGHAVRLVGRTRRLAVVGRAVHRRGRGPHGVPDGRLRRAGRRRRTSSISSCPTPATAAPTTTPADFFPPPGESDVDLIVALFDCLRENGADVPELSTADVLADPSGEIILDEPRPDRPGLRRGGAGVPGHHRRTVSRRQLAHRARAHSIAHSSRAVVHNESAESHTQSALTLHRVRRS